MAVPALSAMLVAPTSEDPTTDRILDAAYDRLLTFGLRRLSVEDVARRAGIARITIYRRFATKDDLVRAVLLREARTLFDEVDAAVAAHDDPSDQLVEGFVAILTAVRDHPLVQRTLATEPDVVFDALTTHGGLAIAVARDYLAGHLMRAQQAGAFGSFDPQPIAEILVRLTATFVAVPESCVRLERDADARAFARRYLLPILPAARPQGARRR